MKPWRKRSFPLYDDLALLVDGIVATGDNAFRPGRPITDKDIDPSLQGNGSHVETVSSVSSLYNSLYLAVS